MNDPLSTASIKWEKTSLNKLLVKFDSGDWGNKTNEKDKGNIVIRSTDFDELGRIVYDKSVRRIIDKKILNKKHLNKGDVLLNKSSGSDKHIGKIIYFTTSLNEKHHFSNFIQRLRVKDDAIINKYLYYYLSSEYGQKTALKFIQTSSGLKNIDLKGYSKQKIPVPPLVEQRGIVEVLGTVNECIRLTDAVIERAEELKLGLMQQLLTRGIGHTEFKDSPLGKIPNSWKIKKLGDVSQLIVPMRDKPKRFEGDIPWIRIDDFDGKFISKSKSSRNVCQKIINEMRLKPYPVGTVLCSCSCTMGICAITKSVLTSNQTFIGIYPNDGLGSEYLYYLMTHNAPNLKKLGSGTTIPYISRKKFSDLKISVPPKNEQEKISSILSEVDKSMEIYQGFRKKYITLKKGLMQILLTGKICVEMMEDGLHRIGDSREANN